MKLSEALAIVDTPEGRARLTAYFESTPFPHFEPHSTVKEALVRVEEGGSRTAGRFLNREFVPLD